MWAWNTPRAGFPGSPKNPKAKVETPKENDNKPKQIKATFTNTGKDPKFEKAELFYDESGYWGKIGHGDEALFAYTYAGHKWNIKVDGVFVKQFVIGSAANQYNYEF